MATVLSVLSLTCPPHRSLIQHIEAVKDQPFSYPEVGATQSSPPAGYHVDRYSQVVGRGPGALEAAKEAIRQWAPFQIPWIQIAHQGDLEVDRVVAVVARVMGVWWTNFSRVVYTIDEPERFGFAYGTLNDHAEIGEERFLVERDPENDEVTYSIMAFSRPRHFLAKWGAPFARATQRRFGRQSLGAMNEAVRESDGGRALRASSVSVDPASWRTSR